MKTLEMYYKYWLKVTKQQRCQDKWLTDKTYFQAVKAQFPTLESLGFHRGLMNKDIGTYGGSTLDEFTESNQTSRFQHHVTGDDHFGNPNRCVWGSGVGQANVKAKKYLEQICLQALI